MQQAIQYYAFLHQEGFCLWAFLPGEKYTNGRILTQYLAKKYRDHFTDRA